MVRWKHVAYTILRWCFFVASLAYLVAFAQRTIVASAIPIAPLIRDAAVPTILSSLVFAVAALMSVGGWYALLRNIREEPIRPLAVLGVFCLTQIAKYLPGNIGHHVGRIALIRSRLGIPTLATAVTILQESALVVAACLIVATACILVAPPSLPTFAGISSRVVLVIALAAGFTCLAIVNHLRSRLSAINRPWLDLLLRAVPAWPAVRVALPWYLLVYVFNGFALAGIYAAMSDVDMRTAILITGAYSLSWMVGFLLPGAPGGLGVRESAFVMLVGNALPAEVSLGLALLSRIANIAADGLIFLMGLLLAKIGMLTPNQQ